jgi:hypothetical protein
MMRTLVAGLLPLITGACDRSGPTANKAETPPFPDRPPVVAASPVDTASYEAGYRAGFSAGMSAGSPRAKAPSEEDVSKLAVDAAKTGVAANSKWRRGWAAGYRDGFRSKSMNIK